MAYDRFLIAPINVGLENDLQPFLIPNDAFARLDNSYVFRGRVRKRFGSVPTDESEPLKSRLRIKLGTTDGSGNISGTVPGAEFSVGQQFSIDDEIFTVTTTGTPSTMIVSGGSSTVRTYNTSTGAYVINGSVASEDVYFYPSTPCMGFALYEQDEINDENTLSFDTQFAYLYDSTDGWDRAGTATWTGSDAQFYSYENYRGVTADQTLMYVVNYNAADQIKYWNGSTWTTINPNFLSGSNTIESARIVVQFKERLLFLNTKEIVSGSGATFFNRCRYSQIGNPLDTDAFRQDLEGGFIDCYTQEQIISAKLLRDRLIVFFERSTWELVYTGNQVQPFQWQQINIELGSESTFSIVPFDKVMIGVGNTGIHACNGANVERIDEKIPDEVFDFNNDNDGVRRVYGIRDYNAEMVYWAIPDSTTNAKFPDRVLVFNYITRAWAFNDDTITAFGYFERPQEQVIAGNQQGYTFLIDTEVDRNAKSLTITNIVESGGVVTLTVINHNLQTDDFVLIEDATGITELNDKIYKIVRVNDNSFTLVSPPTVTGTYSGAGTCALVSRIDILTKQYNFYTQLGDKTYLAKVDFYVDRTPTGEITVDSYPSASTLSMITEGTTTGTILGTGILPTTAYSDQPLEAIQDRFWHAVYFQTEGECTQMRIYFTDDQMTDRDISLSNFVLNGMVIHTMKTHEF